MFERFFCAWLAQLSDGHVPSECQQSQNTDRWHREASPRDICCVSSFFESTKAHSRETSGEVVKPGTSLHKPVLSLTFSMVSSRRDVVKGLTPTAVGSMNLSQMYTWTVMPLLIVGAFLLNSTDGLSYVLYRSIDKHNLLHACYIDGTRRP